MIEHRDDHFLWFEKYRPISVDDCILPDRIKSVAKEIVNSGQIGHMMFMGTAGIGKTSLAKALCGDLGVEYMMINASENGNIDTLRTTIRSFASTMSFTSSYKVVILDEADALTAMTQNSLRGFLEEFAKNCRFIFTCNFSNKIIEPLKSRCSNIDFSYTKKEKQALIVEFDKRVKQILDNESIEYDKKVLAQLIIKHFPDLRRVINELQRFSRSGVLDPRASESVSSESITELFGYLRDPSKWNDMRTWAAQNANEDINVIFRSIYNRANDFVSPSSIPQLVVHLAEYQYRAGFVADPEINLIACLTTIAADCEFK